MVLSCLNKLSLVVMFVLRKSIEIELSSAFAPRLYPVAAVGRGAQGTVRGPESEFTLKPRRQEVKLLLTVPSA